MARIHEMPQPLLPFYEKKPRPVVAGIFIAISEGEPACEGLATNGRGFLTYN
jgi:hypothetical protein